MYRTCTLLSDVGSDSQLVKTFFMGSYTTSTAVLLRR